MKAVATITVEYQHLLEKLQHPLKEKIRALDKVMALQKAISACEKDPAHKPVPAHEPEEIPESLIEKGERR